VTTVKEVFVKYETLILGKVSPGTARGYLVAWRRRVLPTLGDADLTTMTTLDVELAFAAWSGSLSTRIDALALLSAICRVAVKAGLIATNPCLGVERPRVQPDDPTVRALSLDEIDRLFALLPKEGPYYRAVLALLYTGCRLGEIAGLRVSDAEVDERIIRVRRTASAGLHGEVIVGPTKGRRVRVVPMPEPLVPVIREAAAGKGQHDLLFPGPRGGTINSKNLARALDWANIREQIKTFPAGEPSLHFHDLRHTTATLLFRAGVSAPDVQAVLGHSSLQVTQLYARSNADAARRGAAALTDLFRRGQSEGGESPAEIRPDLDF
jgi:integrase